MLYSAGGMIRAPVSRKNSPGEKETKEIFKGIAHLRDGLARRVQAPDLARAPGDVEACAGPERGAERHAGPRDRGGRRVEPRRVGGPAALGQRRGFQTGHARTAPRTRPRGSPQLDPHEEPAQPPRALLHIGIDISVSMLLQILLYEALSY